MTRQFIAGDRVQKKSGGPAMKIVKYVIDHQFGFENVLSDHHVICVWHENNERQTGIFDQRTLFKVEKNLP